MSLKRTINLKELLEKKSFFLFGPRSTGKSTLIREQLAGLSLNINLLDGETFLRLSANPSLLREIVSQQDAKNKIISIDEIQKVPLILDQVHQLIEEEKIRFLLTGSSARKLKSGAANLLGGRAWEAHLFPLTWHEIIDFDLDQYLRYGGLPHVWLSQEPVEELSSYISTYLYEEIQAEGLVRKIPQFSRFLRTAALTNSKIINFSQVASDSGVASSTVREYYSILNDTLIGFQIEPWQDSKKRKAIQTSKFYFFDTGVTHTLAGTKNLDRNSNLWGESFEQFIGMELRAFLSYTRTHIRLQFWRTTSGDEVDFIIEDALAVEVKSTTKVTSSDLKGLKAISQEGVFKHLVCVSNDPIDRQAGNIACLHWNTFLKKLWAKEFS
jgi:uncharacterized protein